MNRQDISLLYQANEYPSVSIFVRTHRTMPDREQDPIAVKNMVREAKDRLLEEFPRRELEEKIFPHIDAAVAKIDYARSKDGIAIFVNASMMKIFRLPVPVKSRVIIDKTFAMGEIDRILHRMVQYWLLTLNEKSVRLYSGIDGILHEVTDKGFPMQYERPYVEAMQYKVNNEMIGHSPHDSEYFDEHKRQFMRSVVQAYHEVVHNTHLPLVVAGIERNISFFRDIEPVLAAEYLSGDVERLSVLDLGDKLEPAVLGLWQKKQAKKLEEFDLAVGKLHHAFGIHSVWRMAQEGRIKDLLVEEGYSVPGVINQGDPSSIMLAADATLPNISDDLVDVLLSTVAKQGGGITFFDEGSLKNYEKIAAILRY